MPYGDDSGNFSIKVVLKILIELGFGPQVFFKSRILKKIRSLIRISTPKLHFKTQNPGKVIVSTDGTYRQTEIWKCLFWVLE